MAAPATLPALLDTLTKSLSSALEAAPKIAGIEVAKDGISLLDVKNDLLLSYLQNLVFLILLKLRQSKTGAPPTSDTDSASLDDLVVRKLIELRVYLEKGVRPLEDKLRYQIDKVLRAADDAERNAKLAEAAAKGEELSSDSDNESNSEEDESGSEADGLDKSMAATKLTDQNFRPNLSAWKRPENTTATSVGKSTDANGIYKPPRIAPTVMPTTERREKKERNNLKSATLDEFIADEMSVAPVAMPSIGTTIVQGGRRTKTASERREEEERREYEEKNFVRLPAQSKKDKAKKAKAEGGRKRMDFGGEEWRDLGQGVDRINRLTAGKSGGKGTKALLEKSRKRGLDTTDGPRGDGSGGMGERYQKRLKVLEAGRRDRGGKKR
ncbi:Sas10/Utp3/C1D family domain containing protein [Naviculisporaceae sp. PSN 640]